MRSFPDKTAGLSRVAVLAVALALLLSVGLAECSAKLPPPLHQPPVSEGGGDEWDKSNPPHPIALSQQDVTPNLCSKVRSASAERRPVDGSSPCMCGARLLWLDLLGWISTRGISTL